MDPRSKSEGLKTRRADAVNSGSRLKTGKDQCSRQGEWIISYSDFLFCLGLQLIG